MGTMMETTFVLDVIPQELRDSQCWVNWRIEKRSGKPTKPPIDPNTEQYANTTDPQTWARFETAVQCANSRKIGIGYVFTEDAGFTGIDLDHCRNADTGKIAPWAVEIITSMNSYTEMSPSGEGVHIWVHAAMRTTKDKHTKAVPGGGKVEIYDRARFFTVTGKRVTNTPATIEPRQAEFDALYRILFPPPSGSGSRNGSGSHMSLNEGELIDKAMSASNGTKFSRLWNGDTSEYHGDESRADQALCNMLAFWTGNEAARIDALFRQSRLMREKWNRTDYRERTINAAIEFTTETFKPRTGNHKEEANEEEAEREAIREEGQPSADQSTNSTATLYTRATPPESFITKYVEYARQRTDAPMGAHELMAVGLLSALAGPKPRLPIATTVTGWPLTLWALYIVNSTTGRKSSTIDYAVDIASEVLGREALMYWEGSPQAIVQRLSERDGEPCIFVRDEYSGILAQMNRGGHMAGLAQTFIRAFDGTALENNRTKKRDKRTGLLENDTDRAERPYLAKLCASTWDSFVMRATIDNVLDGFLARFIVFTGSSEPRRMPLATPELAKLRGSLIDHARVFHRKAASIEQLDIDEDVLDDSFKLEQEWRQRAEKSARPDAAGPALKRLSDAILKVAGLLAIDATQHGVTPRVTADHFRQARQLGTRWLDSTLALIEALGRTGFQKDCEAVLSTIRANPNGMRVRDLYRKHRKLKPRDLYEVLSALQTQDEIDVHEDKGKRGPPFQFVIATRKSKG